MLLYDMTLKFESEIFVKTFGKDFESMMSNLGLPISPISRLGQTAKLEHTISIENSPLLPNDDVISILKNNIFKALTQTLEKQNKLDAEVKSVEFIGILKIQHN